MRLEVLTTWSSRESSQTMLETTRPSSLTGLVTRRLAPLLLSTVSLKHGKQSLKCDDWMIGFFQLWRSSRLPSAWANSRTRRPKRVARLSSKWRSEAILLPRSNGELSLLLSQVISTFKVRLLCIRGFLKGFRHNVLTQMLQMKYWSFCLGILMTMRSLTTITSSWASRRVNTFTVWTLRTALKITMARSKSWPRTRTARVSRRWVIQKYYLDRIMVVRIGSFQVKNYL